MELIADILLVAAAVAAAAYCVVLSRRLRKFTDLEKGVGGAISVLSNQVDGMTKTLRSAQDAAVGSTQTLAQLTGRAEAAAKRLELLVAALHDLPDPREIIEAQSARAAPAPPPEPEPPAEGIFQSRRAAYSEAAE